MSGFVIQTGPNHPGQRMWVQRRDGKSAFDMTGERARAEVFKSKSAASRRAGRYSKLYGLQIVPASESMFVI